MPAGSFRTAAEEQNYMVDPPFQPKMLAIVAADAAAAESWLQQVPLPIQHPIALARRVCLFVPERKDDS